MEEIVINAKPRTVVGKQVKALRREGGLPAILYGTHISPIAVTLDAHEAGKILESITSSHLIVVEVDGDRHNALVKDKQRHPVQGNLLHIDFQVVSMTEKLRTNVMIELEGEAPAVLDYNGVVVSGLDTLEVESLPQDLPERVMVDISGLGEIGDAIYVRDLQLPEAVQVLSDPDEMIALVTAQVAEVEEEEEEEVEEVEAGEEPEVIERGKREEEF
jgi:large subunit ribosomal protein L25